jgi:hypothetical protein
LKNVKDNINNNFYFDNRSDSVIYDTDKIEKALYQKHREAGALSHRPVFRVNRRAGML